MPETSLEQAWRLFQLGRWHDAVALCEQIIQRNPEAAAAWFLLGNSYVQLGEGDRGVVSYGEAIRLQPGFTDCHYNLGVFYRRQGKLLEAQECFERVLVLQSEHIQALKALGNTLYDRRLVGNAIEIYERVRSEAPQETDILGALGHALQEMNRLEEARACYLAQLSEDPGNYVALHNLLYLWMAESKYAEAQNFLRQQQEQFPNEPAFFRAYHLMLPILYDRPPEIAYWRNRYENGLASIIHYQKVESNADWQADLRSISGTCNFFLAYQGGNDRVLQETYGAFVQQVMATNFPQLSQPVPARRSRSGIRIGFVSSYFCDHTIGKLFWGWVQHLNKQQFEVIVYYTGVSFDRLTKNYQLSADRFLALTGTIGEIACQIRQDRLDILIYPDLGMNPQSTLLAGLRLAPVQAAAWGHPTTTGLPTIDYFLSSEAMEPPPGEEHYGEHLVKLPNSSLYYLKPIFPPLQPRSKFGLPDDRIIYLCSQSLFKYLPQYDTLWADLARQVPQALFVFLRHELDAVTLKFQQRLGRVFAESGLDAPRFCRWLPRLPREDYLSLNQISDVFLDPIGWSGGNTTLEALACGLPVVTFPGEMMRSRHALGLLRVAGVTETVADSLEAYLTIAGRLGHDGAWRSQIRDQILAKNHRLFYDRAAIAGLEQFCHEVTGHPETSPRIPLNAAELCFNQQQLAKILREEGDQFEADLAESYSQQWGKITIQSYFEQAVQLHNHESYEAAIELYQQVLTIDRCHVPSHLLLSSLYQAIGNPEKMRWHQLQAMILDPMVASAQEHLQMGNLLARGQELMGAIGCYERAIQRQPDLIEAYFNRGVAYQNLGKREEAILSYQSALGIDPNRIDIYLNLGVLCKELGRMEEAIALYQQALALAPDNANLHNNLANLYLFLNQLDHAIASADRAISLNPDLAQAYDIKGACLGQSGKPRLALEWYRKAIEKNPDFVSAHFNLAHALLRLGELPQGWQEYEWRWGKGSLFLPDFAQPLWDGSYLEGKAIVLWCEQGLGDTLQFIRYVWQVRERGGKVIVACPMPLVRLLREMEGVSAVMSEGSPIPEFDVYIPTMSLPRIFGTTLPSIPATIPYLSAPAGLTIPCLESPRRKIAIAWRSGNPALPDAPKIQRLKSIPFGFFRSLMETVAGHGMQWYSLQVGEGVQELENTLEIIDLSPFITDLADTAGLIEQVDLVLSIDTALAHLAGALGKPVWVLLPFAADWRWFTDREDSPWYPSMRLFRQSQPGDWQGVFHRVEEALLTFEPPAPIPSAEECLTAGNRYFEQRNYAFAERCYQQAIYLKHPGISPYFNLGVIKRNGSQPQEAIAYFEEALYRDPHFAQGYLCLAKAHLDREQLDQAYEAIQQCLRYNPSLAEAYHTLGLICFRQGKNEAAIDCYRQALQRNPADALTHYNLAIALLLSGGYRSGWKEYEWRLSAQDAMIHLAQPRWNGEDLSGKRILLWSEGGFGDTIQFLRYVPILRSKGASILLACQSPLVKLLEQLDYLEVVVPMEQKLSDQVFDLHLPLMSLPFVLALDHIPTPIPYIPGYTRTPAHPPQKIAIVWASGYRSTPNLLRLYRAKSCPIEQFMRLLEVPHIQLHSFQVGKDAHAIQPFMGERVMDWHDRIEDFTDTVGLLNQMDLVITVDTAMVHLAGAMGIPTWLLVPFAPDWRWHEQRADSPWYPTVRLFRQPANGDWASAITAVISALNELQQPLLHRAHSAYTQANTYVHQGNLEAAKLAYLEAIQLNPHLGAAYFNLGVVLKRQGNLRAAMDYYHQSLPLGVEPASVHHALGNGYLAQNQLPESRKHYELALHHQPNFAEAHAFLGEVLRRLKQLDAALDHFAQAIALNPHLAEAYNNWGTALLDQGKESEAIEQCRKALALNPQYALAYSNLGVALSRQGQLAAALECYQTALTIGTPTAEIWNNLGSLLRKQQQYEESDRCFQQAIALKPTLPELHTNRGHVLYELNRIAEASACYDAALSLDPSFATAHLGKAYTYLIEGNLLPGWQGFTWRWQHAGICPPSFPQPPWQGEDIRGKRLLVWGEQGFGDKIQCIRYLSLLQQQGIMILYRSPPSLERLFRTIPDIEVIAEASELPEFDYHIPLMNLMQVLQTTIETIPAQVPYLFPPDSPPLPLRRLGGLKVGFVWASGRHASPMAKESYGRKSCGLEHFIALLSIPHLYLYSLQVGDESAALASVPDTQGRLVDMAGVIQDFFDTATIVQQLDLVITVDTAVAHLAGALGKPVWVLLPFSPDWRWMLDREDTPWYPTMRLFRQTIPGDWQAVFHRVKHCLEQKSCCL